MPRVMQGRHQRFTGVTFSRGKAITIQSGDDFFVHGDGEMVGRYVNRVEIGMLAKALNVIVG
jgi:diacylglycerol kinase family enzyme